MSYEDTTLRDNYRKRWVAVKDVKDDLKRIEIIGTWLAAYPSTKPMAFCLL